MSDQTSFDVVIIGSGAGGAPIAHVLANAGKSVLMLEKGPLLLPQYLSSDGLSDFKRDEVFATGAERVVRVPGVKNQGESFYTSHVEPDLNDEPHVYRDLDGSDKVTIEGYTAQVVGGGTQLYGGVSLRFSPLDFRLASFNRGRTDLKGDPNGDVAASARDWPISYQDLEKYYVRAEKLVGLNGTSQNQAKPFSEDSYQPPLDPNPISQYAAAGMDALGMPRYRTPLAVITRDHAPSGRKAGNPKSGYVNRYGDPLGLKSSTFVALLAPMMFGSKALPNFELRPNCVVTHLSAQGSRISGVHYRDPAGRERTVTGKVVVVACSAIESVRLLLLSAEMDAALSARLHDSGALGRYFLTHCFGGASGYMPERFDKSLSLDSDWATDSCAAEGFLRENGLWAGAAIYNNTSDSALPLSIARTMNSMDLDNFWRGFRDTPDLVGDKLLAFMDKNYGRRLSVSFMANQVPSRENRIELHPTVRDKWNRKVGYILKRWHPHDEYLMNTIAAKCGDIIKAGASGKPGPYGFQFEGQGGVSQGPGAAARIANHVLGGARFGTDPKDAVLDPNCRAFQVDNLYVTDGSFMPTSGGANPTLTIQANSFRVADHLEGRL